MFKKFLFILACPLFLSACSDEPNPDVFMQIAEITNEDGSISKQFSYDSYGRITAFRSTYPTETVNVKYEYVSDNLIKITTEDIVLDYNGAQEFARTYRDELHLEKGQAVFCEGIFSQTQQGIASFEKKYRREFGYTTGNRLNTIKCTEWNRSGDKWDEDSPWTWENYYHWENDNLVKIEDCLGYSYPTTIYTLRYNGVYGAQNIIPIPMDLPQFYPLQLKGIFGSTPANLITEIQREDIHTDAIYTTSYQYTIEDGRITSCQKSSHPGTTDTFSVQWTK